MALCSLSIGSSVDAAVAHRGDEQRAGEHQRFLVREQDALAARRRRERRREAGRADDRGDDRVGFGQRRDRAQPVGARRGPGSAGPRPQRGFELAAQRRASSIAA